MAALGRPDERAAQRRQFRPGQHGKRKKRHEEAGSGNHEGYGLNVHCKCGHWRSVDLKALAATLGREHSYLNESIHFRCTRCGQATTTITVSGPGAEKAKGHR